MSKALKDKTEQLNFEISEIPDGADAARWAPPPHDPNRLAPFVTTSIFDYYWYFAAERQQVFFNRLTGSNERWTDDPIISEFKFTNAYRAADRVSQYLIRNVIYRDDLPTSANELFFRIILFKLFNKIETWIALEDAFGAITYDDYDFDAYDSVLSGLMEAGVKIYSAAYITHPGTSAFGQKKKHQNHLLLLEAMLSDELPKRLTKTTRMQDGYELLVQYPTIGDFLGYQLITDLNYSELVDYSEMEFVVPGPGAVDGIAKCFESKGGLHEVEIIQWMADSQDREFERLGLKFKSLWGRKLQLIDCQNLFCEISKYSRISHPHISGISSRKRIKQKFTANRSRINYWFPPKWGIRSK